MPEIRCQHIGGDPICRYANQYPSYGDNFAVQLCKKKIPLESKTVEVCPNFDEALINYPEELRPSITKYTRGRRRLTQMEFFADIISGVRTAADIRLRYLYPVHIRIKAAHIAMMIRVIICRVPV